jgi:hypothetical protein
MFNVFHWIVYIFLEHLFGEGLAKKGSLRSRQRLTDPPSSLHWSHSRHASDVIYGGIRTLDRFVDELDIHHSRLLTKLRTVLLKRSHFTTYRTIHSLHSTVVAYCIYLWYFLFFLFLLPTNFISIQNQCSLSSLVARLDIYTRRIRGRAHARYRLKYEKEPKTF